MDQAKPEERQSNQIESSTVQEKLAADSRDPLTSAPTALKSADLASRTDVGAAKFLPRYDLNSQMAIWQGGENKAAGVLASSGNEDRTTGQAKGWSERYAANFDQPSPQHLDMAPILGLPQGASKEDLLKTAHAQEEELLKQLIS